MTYGIGRYKGELVRILFKSRDKKYYAIWIPSRQEEVWVRSSFVKRR